MEAHRDTHQRHNEKLGDDSDSGSDWFLEIFYHLTQVQSYPKYKGIHQGYYNYTVQKNLQK